MKNLRFLPIVAVFCSITVSQIQAAVQTLTGNGITLTYDDTTCGGVSTPATCNATMQSVFNNNSNQFQLGVLNDYLKFMSSAQSITTKGHGVDYTTNPSVFVVGVSGGAGVDIGSKTFAEAKDSLNKSGSIPAAGYAYQFSIMAGLNLGILKGVPALGPLDLKRLTVYGHGGGYDFSSLVKQDGLTVKTMQFGFHGKYKIIEPKSVGFGALHWGGLDFVSGLTIASNTLGYSKSFDSQSAGTGTTTDPRITVTPVGTITVQNTAVAVPFEIATSVRILYLLSLFGGAGIDLNFGKSTIDMALTSSSITTTVGGATTTMNNASLKVNASESSGGRFGDIRFFAGTALNLIPMKNSNLLSFVVQGNISMGGGYGVLMGVRAGW